MLLSKSQRFVDAKDATPGPAYDPRLVEVSDHAPKFPAKPPEDAPKSSRNMPWIGRRVHVKNDLCIVSQPPVDVQYINPPDTTKTPSALVSTCPRFDIQVDKENKSRPGPAYLVEYNNIATNAVKPKTEEEIREARKKARKAKKLSHFHGRPYELNLSPGPGSYSADYRPRTAGHKIGTGRRWLGANEYLGKAYERKNLATFGPGPKYNINERPITAEVGMRTLSTYSSVGGQGVAVDHSRVFCEKAQMRNDWQMGVRVNGYILRRNVEDCGSQLGPGAYKLPSDFDKKSFNKRVNKDLKVINRAHNRVEDIKERPENSLEEDSDVLPMMAALGLEKRDTSMSRVETSKQVTATSDLEDEDDEDEEAPKLKRKRRKKKKKGLLWREGDKYTNTGRDVVRRYREKRHAMIQQSKIPKMMFGTQARGHHSEQVRAFSGMRQGTRNQVMQHMLNLYADDGIEDPPDWNLG